MMYDLRSSVASVLTLLFLGHSAAHAIKDEDKGSSAPKATSSTSKPASEENTTTPSVVPPAFDVDFYLSNAPALRKMTEAMSPADRMKAAWNHYVSNGIREGRQFRKDLPAFNAEVYLSLYDDLQRAFAHLKGEALKQEAISHFFSHGMREGRKFVKPVV